jgi:5-methylcytosine-specific restriction endonuclease McrA
MARPVSGICRVCNEAKPPGHCQPCRRARIRRGNLKASARRPARACRDCCAPIGKWRMVCDTCRVLLNRKNVLRQQILSPEKARARNDRWKKKNPDRISVYNQNTRAQRLGAPGHHSPDEWSAVLKKFGRRCVDCGATGKLTKDHIVPISAGGTNFAFNLQPLCMSCNCRKNAKLLPGAHPSLFDREMAYG